MRIKAIAAVSEPEICSTLQKEGHFAENKMEILTWVKSTEELLDQFDAVNPRLVIIDQAISGMSAANCIRRINRMKEKCQFLVLGSADDPEFMYDIFRCRKTNYVTKPIITEHLNEALERISRDIRRMNLEDIVHDSQISMQSLYVWKMMDEDSEMAKDMEFLNHITGVYFKEGLFRAVLFRLDQVHGEMPQFKERKYYLDINDIQRQIKAYTNQCIYEYCYDMILDFRFNGVLLIINYAKEYDRTILDKMEQIREVTSKYSILTYGMTLTVCVGQAYEKFQDVYKSREEAYQASWTRMKRGTGRVLYYSRHHDMHEDYQLKLENIIEELKVTAQTISIDDFLYWINELFLLPDFVLTNYHTRDLIVEFVDYFFEINEKSLSHHLNIWEESEDIKKILNFSPTLKEYRANFEKRFSAMLRILEMDMEKENIRPLRKAVRYIKDNYSKPITVEILAGIVSLNPVYFSHLFKVQTGMNITDYITNYRMDIAKKLLFETDMSISEVAASVGFQDQRYFAKRFKQINGMTPSEYRKKK